MLDRMGVIEDLLATGVKSTGMKMVANGKTLVRVPLDAVDSAFPYTFVTAQTETERVLGNAMHSGSFAYPRRADRRVAAAEPT